MFLACPLRYRVDAYQAGFINRARPDRNRYRPKHPFNAEQTWIGRIRIIARDG